MTRRTITQDERSEFEAAFAETRPLVPKATGREQQKRVLGKPALTGGLDGRTAERLRRGLIDPRAKLDFHGYTEAAAHAALLAFLKNSRSRGHRLVLVVTGRGARNDEDVPPLGRDQRGPRGVLKAAVPRWLNEPEFAGLIAGTQAAHRKHGGNGALYIYLRKPPS
jgi:DNA-nicking Smr family endonuclease